MQSSRVINQLLQGKTPGLAIWMGDPVDAEAALFSLDELQNRMRTGNLDVEAAFGFRLGEVIARFWAGKDIEAGYKNLLVLLEGARQESRLELCIGQLLIARKLSQAWTHLDRGFQLAAHLLEPEDYFLVLKRHELLRQLSLSVVGAEAAGLETLLNEARVIASLRGRGMLRGNTTSKHRDTID